MGTIGMERRAAALAVARILLGAAGAFLLIRRPRVTAVHLTAAALGVMIAGVAGAAVLQVAYVPPPIVSGWTSLAPASEQTEFGFRGRRIEYLPDDHVVVLLGDSQVESAALAFDGMPERLLEASLNSQGRRTKVFTRAPAAWQDRICWHFKNTSRATAHSVVPAVQGNDIWNNVFMTHMATEPEADLVDGSERCMSERVACSALGNSRLSCSPCGSEFGLPWRDRSWERHSPVYAAGLFEGPVCSDWQERWNTNLGRMRDEELTEKVIWPSCCRLAARMHCLDLTRER